MTMEVETAVSDRVEKCLFDHCHRSQDECGSSQQKTYLQVACEHTSIVGED